MKTAVEYLVHMYALQGVIYQDDIDKAIEIEKEQIVNAHFDGCEIGEIFAYENREFITDSEQYYSKTFKQ